MVRRPRAFYIATSADGGSPLGRAVTSRAMRHGASSAESLCRVPKLGPSAGKGFLNFALLPYTAVLDGFPT